MTTGTRPTLASMIGSPVEIWYDRRQCVLMVKDALGYAIRSIQSICLSNVRFHMDRNGRGGFRRYVTGTLLCDPNAEEAAGIRQAILRAAGGFMAFHWTGETSWPMETAARAVISMPRGGFHTSAAHA